MARQDLFDQRRPRARHAQDEHRIGSIAALPGARGKERRRGHGDGAIHELCGLIGTISELGAAQRVARRIVRKGRLHRSAIFERLAQREVEVEAVLLGHSVTLQRGLHRGDIGIAELDGFEVGQAPPCLTQTREQPNRFAVGLHPLGLLPDGFEHMPVAHPDARLVRGFFQHLRIKHQRIVEVTDAAQRGGLQVGVAGIVRVFGQHLVELRNRLRRAVLAVEHQRQIGPRRGEARSQLHRAAQQRLAVLVAPDPPGQLGQHSDRGDIERMRFQMRAQARFGIVQPVFVHRQRRLDQRGRILSQAGQPGLCSRLCHRAARNMVTRRNQAIGCGDGG